MTKRDRIALTMALGMTLPGVVGIVYAALNPHEYENKCVIRMYIAEDGSGRLRRWAEVRNSPECASWRSAGPRWAGK